MRRFILQSIILIFAASGIVCACPGEISAAASNPHQSHGEMQHSEHGEPAAGTQEDLDCCDDCVEFNAVERDYEHALTNELRTHADDPESDPIEHGSLARLWPSAIGQTKRLLRFQYRLHATTTPVTFFDRMLD